MQGFAIVVDASLAKIPSFLINKTKNTISASMKAVSERRYLK